MAKQMSRNRQAPLLLLVAATLASPGLSAGASDAPEPMAGMSGHMYLSQPHSPQRGDGAKAAEIVAAAKTAMAPYQDYHKALADGYRIFLPNVPQPLYHFTNYQNSREARNHFDPLKPTSLLYRKTQDGGYTLIGAMYTDRVDAKMN